MYSDIGKKIMTLAVVCSWIALISSILIWLCNLGDGNPYNNAIGWIWIGIGGLSFISSWPLYGFGQLIDDIHAIRNRTAEPAMTVAQDDELPEL